MSSLTTFIKLVVEVLDSAIRHTDWNGRNITLFVDDTIMYMEMSYTSIFKQQDTENKIYKMIPFIVETGICIGGIEQM